LITEIKFKKGKDACPTIEWRRKMSDEEFKTATEKVVCFAASTGVEVKFSSRYRCTHKVCDKIIYMNSRMKPSKTYYILLHEMGHSVIQSYMTKGQDHSEYMLNYPGNVDENTMCYTAEGGREHLLSKKDQRRRNITIIHEELDAWRKGIDIAAILQLPLSLYDYYSMATKGVESYVVGAVVDGNLKL